MSSSSAQSLVNGTQLAPLRSLDDFILGSARFQFPNIQDLEKWGNRVVKNLLYYQSNYFLMFAAIYTLMLILNPGKIFCGLLVKASIVVIGVKFFSSRGGAQNVRQESKHEKWIYLVASLFCGYLLLAFSDALLLSGFTLLLPFSLSFVHASLRLRNIKNKVANTIESLGPSTPMGVFLDTMNITVDNILS